MPKGSNTLQGGRSQSWRRYLIWLNPLPLSARKLHPQQVHPALALRSSRPPLAALRSAWAGRRSGGTGVGCERTRVGGGRRVSAEFQPASHSGGRASERTNKPNANAERYRKHPGTSGSEFVVKFTIVFGERRRRRLRGPLEWLRASEGSSSRRSAQFIRLAPLCLL